jgi:hypothetical protein
MRYVQARYFIIKEKDGASREVIFSDETIRTSLKRLQKTNILNTLLPGKITLKIGMMNHNPINFLFLTHSPYMDLNYISKIIVHPLEVNVKAMTPNELNKLLYLNHPLTVKFFHTLYHSGNMEFYTVIE